MQMSMTIMIDSVHIWNYSVNDRLLTETEVKMSRNSQQWH